MLDIPIRRVIDPILDTVAARLVGLGMKADQLTWGGFLFGLMAGVGIAWGWFGVAFALITLNRLCDGLDGCVARLRGSTDRGGYLDITLDMIFYSTIPFSFAVYGAENQLPAAFLIYSFMGTGSSFLAFAVISAKRGTVADAAEKKSFFYSTGLIEGTETAVFLWLVCLIPDHFPMAAWIFGTLCWITTAIRIAVATQAFVERAKE